MNFLMKFGKFLQGKEKHVKIRPYHSDLTRYIGVGEEDEVQLFYYFIQSENDPARDPLILWLTGGPGCSGFSGLVYEIGPLAFDLEGFDGSFPSFTLNPYSWTKTPLLGLDSLTPLLQAYNNSDTKSAQYNSSFLRKWLLNHLEFVKNRLYIAGDSYGGKITPMVALEIAKGNEAGLKPRMSLQGYIVGNAVIDANKGSNEKVPFAHGMGLVPHEYFELAKGSCNGEYANPNPNKQCLYALQLVNEGTIGDWKSGDHDMAISYISTLKWIHKLNLTLERGWRPWFVNGQVAGHGGSGKRPPVLLGLGYWYSIARYRSGRPGNKKILKLQGYIVGNAVTDTIEGLNERVPFAHGMGLISDEYFECISAINVEHIGELSCNLLSSGPNVSQPGELLLEDPIDLIFLPKHERTFCRRYNYVISYVWANNETVREALHIREGTVTDWQRCNGILPYERCRSVFKHHKLLSEKGFRALVYSGDHDMAISYISTLKWIRNLNLTLKEEWRPCFCNNTLVINVANDMVKTKNDNQKKLSQCSTNAPIGILTRARDFYSNTICHCGGGVDRRSVVNCTVPRTNHVGSSKLENGINEDLQGLMRLLAARKGGGAKVDVDSEGNLWRIPAAAEGVVVTSYGGGVGKIGRIDEDKPCCFMEVDVNKLTYSSSTSGNNNKIITRRNVAF
ncbi:Serine carboxypeptidase-like 2 [Sesamum angolense]|uniref:Serine carboxypeptidase-like 2 n=1 Tax=Sesamum angolense TaxID=2727404 RepID=A0AAE2BXU9_9LAMI|nr:Serine carboxypeptidase-like 2 [Sesamum angolense]